MYEMLKSIGGIENLVDLNKKIQEKLKEVEEAVKYIGRIGAKTEKEFMDLSRGMDDLVLLKAKQEDSDESLKDVIKNIDSLNVKFEGYVSKKDLDVFREDILLIKKQLENVSKVLPLIDAKLPQEIIDLRKEREDILLLLDSLQEQYENKKISKSEYNNFKEGNEKRLKEIEKQLEKEWKKVEKITGTYGKEKSPEETETGEQKPIEEKIAEAVKLEQVKTEVKNEEAKESEEVKKKVEEVKEMFEKNKEEKIFKEEKKEKVEESKNEKKEVLEQTKEETKRGEKPPEIKKLEKKVKHTKKIKKVKNIKHEKPNVGNKKESGKIKILNDIKRMKI